MSHLRLRAALACTATVFALVACGGDDAADPATTTSTEAVDDTTTSTTEAAEDTTTTTAQAPDTTTGLDVEEFATSLLVSVDELNEQGDGSFVDIGYEDIPGPGLCGQEVDAEFPPDVLVGARYGSEPLQLAFQEEIRVYDSAETAQAAYAAGIAALSCGSSEDGSITIEAPVDVTDAVGGDEAQAFEVGGVDLRGGIVVVLLSDSVVVFQFQGTLASPTEGIASPIDVAAFGIAKITDAIEG